MPNSDWAPIARGALRALAIICRVCAWLLVALVAINCVYTGSNRVALVSLNSTVSSVIPAAISGLFVMVTPLGGSLRGDFAIFAIILLVVDWLLCKVAASLR